MKVLTVIDSLEFSGAERLLTTLAKAAPSVDMQLSVASLREVPFGRRSTVPRLEASGISRRSSA